MTLTISLSPDRRAVQVKLPSGYQVLPECQATAMLRNLLLAQEREELREGNRTYGVLGVQGRPQATILPPRGRAKPKADKSWSIDDLDPSVFTP